ncbi:efflux RND transporter periplasmic adaptor subunit [Motiliproteus sediminis]|uniref:efflux RND transporter periplasmic adaptor subunit n=1 Tax=Motiliproteus sediminis TaxID=1468178 RepID=UPI001AEF9EB1|nr:efflux RND transporter periplasmic adaptor subunit [Motiliproteus sediminis]
MTNLTPPLWQRLLLPLLVLGLCLAVVYYLVNNKPKAERGRSVQQPVVSVEAMRLQPTRFQVELDSFGVVQPRTESRLIPQISGQVVAISERFRAGAFFEAGEVLVEIDDRDYRAELEIAKAQLVEAQLRLSEEQARARQAQRDWERLGDGDAGDLVLRRPQVAAAQAAIASARARLTTAELNLERTKIKAPYAGRVLTKLVDVGQVVTPSTELASVYAVDYVEVRLPLKSRQLQYIDLPEQYRDGGVSSANQPEVMLEATLGNRLYRWAGRVVRVEGAIDQATRQLYVVAQVDDPYGRNERGNPPLKIGQFVRARITGEQIDGVFVLPRGAVRQDNRVLLVEQGRLQARAVKPVWFDEHYVVVAEGLKGGDILSLTPLGTGAEGALVKATVDGQPLVQQAQKPAVAPVATTDPAG